MASFNNTTYNVYTNNCQDAVNAALKAEGLEYFNSDIPNAAAYHDAHDVIYSNNHGPISNYE